MVDKNRFTLPPDDSDDCPGKLLMENATCLKLTLWKLEDGLQLSYRVSGSIGLDDDEAAPIDPQQFAKDLMAAFSRAKT